MVLASLMIWDRELAVVPNIGITFCLSIGLRPYIAISCILHKVPPIGSSSTPIKLKIELDQDIMVIHPHMKYEKDRTKTEDARVQTRSKV